MAARIIKPNVQKVNANLPNANFPPISLSYLGIALACEVPGVYVLLACDLSGLISK
jgi:hypothetical protein